MGTYKIIGMDQIGNEVARAIYAELNDSPMNSAVGDMLNQDRVTYVEVRPDRETTGPVVRDVGFCDDEETARALGLIAECRRLAKNIGDSLEQIANELSSRGGDATAAFEAERLSGEIRTALAKVSI